MPSSYSSSAAILKIDPKPSSEGVIESEQSFVIPKLSVLHANGGSFTSSPFQSAYECSLLLSSTFDASPVELVYSACVLRVRPGCRTSSCQSAESRPADEEVPPHCPDPHPKWPLRVTSVSLCPASLRAPGRIGPTFGREKSVHWGLLFLF